MFQNESAVRQGFIMPPWLFNVYMDAVMKKVKVGMERMGVRFLEGGSEWRLPSLLYEDGLVLCRESEEDLKENDGGTFSWCVEEVTKSMQIRTR